jgi:hypothetical protein
MSCAPQGVHCRPLPLSQLDMFSPFVRILERSVHAPASALLSPGHDGSSSPPICGWWIPRVFGGFPDGERSSSEIAWYTHAVSSNSICSLPASIILFKF